MTYTLTAGKHARSFVGTEDQAIGAALDLSGKLERILGPAVLIRDDQGWPVFTGGAVVRVEDEDGVVVAEVGGDVVM